MTITDGAAAVATAPAPFAPMPPPFDPLPPPFVSAGGLKRLRCVKDGPIFVGAAPNDAKYSRKSAGTDAASFRYA
ncbi:MAG TPA: hypothetical protein VF395_13130, partial [Polyangiaceae bacterium]